MFKRELIIGSCALLLAVQVRAQDGWFPASLAPLPEHQWNATLATHLLNRAGFGGTPQQVRELAELGCAGAVDYLVDFEARPYTTAPPAMDELVRMSQFELRSRYVGLSEEERREARQQYQRLQRQAAQETRLWWLERLIESPRQLEEKMVLFWHGHFTSGIREVRNALYLYEQNELFREHAVGDFGALLTAVSKDRAMLVYLDGARNRKQQPNENYARELLELFTLGEGNYSERDIKAAARAFTGWGFDDEGFLFRRTQHDFGSKTFLGETGNWGGEDIIRIILEQRRCSLFLSEALLKYFVRSDPHPVLVRAFAEEIRKHQFVLKPALRTLFRSKAFYHPQARGALVKSPVELIVSTARKLGRPVGDLRAALRACDAMGQSLLQPPNVKGWDGGPAWINTASLFLRYNYVGGLIFGEGRGKRRTLSMQERSLLNDEEAALRASESMRDMSDGKSRAGNVGISAFDPIPWVRTLRLEGAEAIVDAVSAHLLAVPLSESKRAAVVRYLQGERGEFSLDQRDARERLQMTLHLLMSCPEYQLY